MATQPGASIPPLKTVPPDENGSAILLLFYYWKMSEKTVILNIIYQDAHRIRNPEKPDPGEPSRCRSRKTSREKYRRLACRQDITAMDPKHRSEL